MAKMALIIPYRDRREHLNRLLPHLVSYFHRDKLDRTISPVLVLVEQVDARPFNRGALLNAGFLAVEESVDYACFHDVDYLPIWADYSVPEHPTRIVWWGLHKRPVRENRPDVVVTTSRTVGLGGVSVMRKTHFREVNGFSNEYWGWGFEDTDLVARFRCAGIPIDTKEGTFSGLDHDNAGLNEDGSKSPQWLRNEAIFAAKSGGYPARGYLRDGLSTFQGTIRGRETVEARGYESSERAALIHVGIDLTTA